MNENGKDNDQQKPLSVAQAATLRIVSLLREDRQNPGSRITDEELIALTGLPVDTLGNKRTYYQVVQKAVERIIREDFVLWKRVFRAGCIQCVSDSDVNLVAESNMRGMQRRSTKVGRILNCVDVEKLDEEQKYAYYGRRAQVGAIHELTKKKKHDEITQLVGRGEPNLDVIRRRLLQAFQG